MRFGKSEIERALSCGEIVLHYLPQIALGWPRRVVGLKALARWEHPKLGLTLPDTFIGSIEELGFTDRFDLLVADRALSDLLRLTAIVPEGLRLTLNLSPASLQNSDFPELLTSVAKKRGAAPESIVVELSVSRVIGKEGPEWRTLQKLRMAGFPVCVNDYGTGSVRIEHLHCIWATELKIDRFLIQNLPIGCHDRLMVQKMVLIAHELGMKITAEGVERSQQLEFLSREGCDYAQGYRFSRPLSPEPLVNWLQHFQLSS